MSGHAWHMSVAEAKKARIIDAARALFLERGYSRTAVADVAQRANVSSATLYKHFETKDALFAAVLDGLSLRFAQALDVAPPVEGGGLRLWLETFGAAYADLLSDPEVVGMARAVIAEAPSFQPIAQRFLQAMKGPVFHRLETTLRQAVAQGELAAHAVPDSMGQFLGYIERSVLLPQLLDPGHRAEPANNRHVAAVGVATLIGMNDPTRSEEPARLGRRAGGRRSQRGRPRPG